MPAEEPLAAGRHRITVRPIDASGRAGKLSPSLGVTITTRSPNAPTIRLGYLSDTGTKGDGLTIVNRPTFRGHVQPGRLVNVSIDDVFAGQVQSDPRTGAWSFQSLRTRPPATPWLWALWEVPNDTDLQGKIAGKAASLPDAPGSHESWMNDAQWLDATLRETLRLFPSV